MFYKFQHTVPSDLNVNKRKQKKTTRQDPSDALTLCVKAFAALRASGTDRTCPNLSVCCDQRLYEPQPIKPRLEFLRPNRLLRFPPLGGDWRKSGGRRESSGGQGNDRSNHAARNLHHPRRRRRRKPDDAGSRPPPPPTLDLRSLVWPPLFSPPRKR
uniref:Uncharacterized protein n=1 Tax=Noccaea caerulescens TaxID=107243 RepID=A0A1J3JQS0_NOCCA